VDQDSTRLSELLAVVCRDDKIQQSENRFCCSDLTDNASTTASDVKSSMSKWPRGPNFGLGIEALASASEVLALAWPRSRCLIM